MANSVPGITLRDIIDYFRVPSYLWPQLRSALGIGPVEMGRPVVLFHDRVRILKITAVARQFQGALDGHRLDGKNDKHFKFAKYR